MTKKEKKEGNSVSRREFLKLSGTAAAALQVGAAAGAGFASGKDPATLTGWQHLGDTTQFVDRKPFEFDGVPYEIVGETRRPKEVESAFGRQSLMMRDMMRAQREGMRPPEKKTGQQSQGPPEAT